MEQVLTADGRFRGILKDGVEIYRGITYATYERFHDPVMTDPKGETDATGYGCVCPQRSCRLASVMGEDKGSIVEEGRLCLSIYSPAGTKQAPDKPVPVMVWIHGGSFQTGGSEEHRYSGERLVRVGDVVVVKISYRLGALGYLYLPEKGIANLGLKDQKMALGWVRRNIHSFGGDPGNITVFGQSAGALSVSAMIATATEPLPFAKAIMQSDPLGITITPKEASRISKAFLKKLGKNPQEASLDEILDAQEAVGKMKTGLTFMPMVQDFMGIPPAARGIKAVVGCTSEDASPFLKALGPLFDTFIGRAAIRYATKKIFSRPTSEYLERMREAGMECDSYLITWHPKGNPLGSCHCIELPFLLGEYDDWKDAGMLQGMTMQEFETGSTDLLKAWTGYARTGVLRHEGIIIRGKDI